MGVLGRVGTGLSVVGAFIPGVGTSLAAAGAFAASLDEAPPDLEVEIPPEWRWPWGRGGPLWGVRPPLWTTVARTYTIELNGRTQVVPVSTGPRLGLSAYEIFSPRTPLNRQRLSYGFSSRNATAPVLHPSGVATGFGASGGLGLKGDAAAIESVRRGALDRLVGTRLWTTEGHATVLEAQRWELPSTPTVQQLKGWLAAWSRILDEERAASPVFDGIDLRSWAGGGWIDSWHADSPSSAGARPRYLPPATAWRNASIAEARDARDRWEAELELEAEAHAAAVDELEAELEAAAAAAAKKDAEAAALAAFRDLYDAAVASGHEPSEAETLAAVTPALATVAPTLFAPMPELAQEPLAPATRNIGAAAVAGAAALLLLL